MRIRIFTTAVAALTLAGGAAVFAQSASDPSGPAQGGQMPMMQGQGMMGQGTMGQGMGGGMQMRHGMQGGMHGGMQGGMQQGMHGGGHHGMRHGKGRHVPPTLHVMIESEARTLHFMCHAEMDDCLKALAQVQGAGQ